MLMVPTKTKMDVEKLLHWAYRDELSKRTTSSAEGIWDKINDRGRVGIDPGHGAAQRYPHFGLPHPDADRIEKAVGALPDAVIDWDAEAEAVLGDLLMLADPRTPPLPARTPADGWIRRDGKMVKVGVLSDRPREVILVRSLRTAALVTMHAGMGTRPNWREDQPTPFPIEQGSKVSIVGECRGKNLYTTGSYCPLRWSPSPLVIAEARADYLAWWRGMKTLVETLMLEDFAPLMPEAAEMPWRTPEPKWSLVSRGTAKKAPPLPLKPGRKLAGPKKQQKRSGAVRKIACFGGKSVA